MKATKDERLVENPLARKALHGEFKDGDTVTVTRETLMKLKVDDKNDALYFRLDESAIVESEEVKPGVILDFDEAGNVVGVEILGLRKRVAPKDLKILQFESV